MPLLKAYCAMEWLNTLQTEERPEILDTVKNWADVESSFENVQSCLLDTSGLCERVRHTLDVLIAEGASACGRVAAHLADKLKWLEAGFVSRNRQVVLELLRRTSATDAHPDEREAPKALFIENVRLLTWMTKRI